MYYNLCPVQGKFTSVALLQLLNHHSKRISLSNKNKEIDVIILFFCCYGMSDDIVLCDSTTLEHEKIHTIFRQNNLSLNAVCC